MRTAPRPSPAASLPLPDDPTARAGSENFAVASRLLPAAIRADLMAIYGFARLIDDIGDDAPGDRLALLDEAESELERTVDPTARPSHPVFRRLERTIRAHGIPIEPFRRLIEANRQDQRVTRYQTYDALLRYCALSANPVGHMVLYVLGAATPERMALSDRVCSALQLVEHWQDVAEDLARGRVYLPQEDLERFGVCEADLAAPVVGTPVRRLMAFEAERARSLLLSGEPLASTLPGRMGLAVAGFAGGGLAALDALRRGGYDVLGAHPRPSRARRSAAVAAAMARAAARRGTARSLGAWRPVRSGA